MKSKRQEDKAKMKELEKARMQLEQVEFNIVMLLIIIYLQCTGVNGIINNNIIH